MSKPNLRGRLNVWPEVLAVMYHRPPTAGEIKFGEGATHYRSFNLADCCHSGTRIPKRWIVAADDGLRYYR